MATERRTIIVIVFCCFTPSIAAPTCLPDLLFFGSNGGVVVMMWRLEA